MQREEWQELRRLRGSGSGERRRVQVEPFLCNRSLFFFLVGRAWASTRQHLEWGNGRGHDQVLACSVSEKGHVVGGDHEDGEVQVLGGGVAALVELEVGPLWADEGDWAASREGRVRGSLGEAGSSEAPVSFWTTARKLDGSTDRLKKYLNRSLDFNSIIKLFILMEFNLISLCDSLGGGI
ncbi:hypothetical protein ACSQ67_021799 [Phaseolus vulgaris]